MADVGEGPMLLAKKFGGLVLVVLGMLGVGFGYESGSGSLTVGGFVVLVVGVALLAIKVMRQTPR